MALGPTSGLPPTVAASHRQAEWACESCFPVANLFCWTASLAASACHQVWPTVTVQPLDVRSPGEQSLLSTRTVRE